ncbi:MAG: hypothetical protein ACQESF_04630 [Nanobdellota archaeon]
MKQNKLLSNIFVYFMLLAFMGFSVSATDIAVAKPFSNTGNGTSSGSASSSSDW